MNKTMRVRVVSFALAGTLALCGAVARAESVTRRYHEATATAYDDALGELTERLESITDELHREKYAYGDELASLGAKISADAAAAKLCLAHLPLSEDSAEPVYKFLSQAGAYSQCLASGINDERLEKLYNYSAALSRSVSRAEALLSETQGRWDAALDDALDNIALPDVGISDEALSDLDYPTLIYDGPFSEHLSSGESYLINNSAAADVNEAKAVAKSVFGGKSEPTLKGVTKSSPEYYEFADDTSVCAVTKQGKMVLFYKNMREIGDKTVGTARAKSIAKSFLRRHFGGEFFESYSAVDGGIININFFAVQDGVVCYPDLVKVGVALDNGGIVSLEAAGYIMNHHPREMSFVHSPAQAKAMLGDTAEGGKRCIISPYVESEYCCYEFAVGDSSRPDALIYVDANTLEERQILLLEYTDGGALTR